MADMRMLQVGDAVRLRYDGAYVTIDKIVCVYPNGNVLYVVRFDIGGRTCRMRADELIAR